MSLCANKSKGFGERIYMKKTKGFSILELIIVITILGILGVAVVPITSNAVEKAKIIKYLSDCRSIASAVELYNIELDYSRPTIEDKTLLREIKELLLEGNYVKSWPEELWENLDKDTATLGDLIQYIARKASVH